MNEEIQPKESFIKRFWWIGVIALVVIIVLVISIINSNRHKIPDASTTGPSQENFIPDASITESESKEIQWPSTTAKYITATPLDLTQIQSISRYRSCAGHDFSGYSFGRTLETNRSMKHYIYPTPAFQGTTDKVKMFAPFDGTVSKIYLESENPKGRPKGGHGIAFSTTADIVIFEFSHIYFAKDFKVGDEIKSGELIGYAALGEKENDFDIVLTGPQNMEQSIFGTVFDHMTDPVLAEFAKYGITPENTKISKEVRDASPCDYNANQQDGRNGNGWVTLKY